MGSFHDSMASHFGAPMLFSHFRERDANGETEPVELFGPGQATGVPAVAIVGQLATQDAVEIGTGTTEHEEIQERVEAWIPAGLEASLETKVAVPRYAGERFAVESIDDSGSMVKLQLMRYAVARVHRRGINSR